MVSACKDGGFAIATHIIQEGLSEVAGESALIFLHEDSVNHDGRKFSARVQIEPLLVDAFSVFVLCAFIAIVIAAALEKWGTLLDKVRDIRVTCDLFFEHGSCRVAIPVFGRVHFQGISTS